MAHPNEDLLCRGYEAFATGDLETVAGLMTDDVVWHGGGGNQLTGDFRDGKPAESWLLPQDQHAADEFWS